MEMEYLLGLVTGISIVLLINSAITQYYIKVYNDTFKAVIERLDKNDT